MRKIFLSVYVLVGFIRLSSIVFFLQYPLTTWIIIFILDTTDYFWAQRGRLTYPVYQRIDKSLDFLISVYFVITAFVLGWEVVWLFVFLFFFRVIGDIFYILKKSEKYLFYFPNIIEFFFPAYIIYLYFLQDKGPKIVILGTLFLLTTILKLFHEYLLHIKNWMDPISRAYVEKHPEHKRKIT